MEQKRCMRAALALVLAGGLGISACASPAQSGNAGERFDAYMDDLFYEDIVLNTVNLHYTLAHPENYGITEYEVTLGDYSSEKMEEGYEDLEEMKKELASYDREDLSADQQLTYDIFMDYADTELDVKDLTYYSEPLGPIGGVQSNLPVILAEYTFRTKQDIEDYLVLAGQMDEYFADVIEFEKEKAAAGLFMPDDTADDVLEQCTEFIADIENNYMIDVFNDKIDAFDGLSDEERQAYKDQNYLIVTTDVRDAFQILIDGLTELKGSGENELGLCYYEDGLRYYKYLIRTGVGTDASASELIQRTKNYMDRCMDQMVDVIAQNPELWYEIDDYAFPLTDPDEILADLTEKIQTDFPEPPDVGYEVKYVHPSMQEHMSPAFYLTTPIDDIDNNVIYINPEHLGEDSAQDLYTTLAHEGYPGHLYQNSCTNSSNLPLARNLLGCSGYTEGWATYVEFYSYGISGLDKNLTDVLRWNQAFTLGIYAYLDLQIHYNGWDRDDVKAYLNDYGIDDEEAADEIFETLRAEPAEYLNYFIGYLEFLNLRNNARKELGDSFSAKEFHRFLMETGPAPFYIIRQHMGTWIEEQRAA